MEVKFRNKFGTVAVLVIPQKISELLEVYWVAPLLSSLQCSSEIRASANVAVRWSQVQSDRRFTLNCWLYWSMEELSSEIYSSLWNVANRSQISSNMEVKSEQYDILDGKLHFPSHVKCGCFQRKHNFTKLNIRFIMTYKFWSLIGFVCLTVTIFKSYQCEI